MLGYSMKILERMGEDLELGVRLHLSGAHFFVLRSFIAPSSPSTIFLNQFCKLTKEYGLRSLPILLDKQPALKDLLRLSFCQETKTN